MTDDVNKPIHQRIGNAQTDNRQPRGINRKIIMEKETNDVAVDTDTEVEEDVATNDNEEEVAEEGEEAIKEKLADALKAKAELTARAKKAEEELKTLKAKPQPQNNDPQLKEELKLIARGLTDEAIEKAKIIAKGKDISLVEATKDPLFSVYQKSVKEEERKAKAKLGATKGSGESLDKPKGFKSGSTRDEHMAAFQEKVGK